MRNSDTLGRNALIAGGVVLATVVAAVGFGQIPVQTPVPQRPLELAGHTSMICPAARDVTALVASGREDGELEVGGLNPGTLQPTSTNTVTAHEELTGPMTVRAGGGQASASAAAVFANRDSGPDRGVTLGACPKPGGVHWFAGLGANDTMRSVIVLTNPDDRQVSVDVVFHGPDGEVATPGTRGIVVPAQESREIAVESYVSGDALVSAQVRARQGRVAAIVRDRAGGDRPRGATYVSGSVAPATHVVIPGLPDGPGDRNLVVVNPGERRTRVSVEVLGPDGTFVPVGGEDLAVNPKASAVLDLAPGLNGQTGAVRVTSDQPVTGAVVSTSTDDPNRQDLAVQPAVEPISGMGFAAAGVVPGLSSAVVATNTGDAEAVLPLRVVTTAGGQLAENALVVPAGQTRVWKLPESEDPGSVIAEVAPGSQVYASVLVSGDKGFDRMGTAPFLMPQPEAEGLAPEADPRVG